MHGMTTAERRVRRRLDGWAVSFEPRGPRYEINQWPNDESLVQGILVSLTRMPTQFHDFNLARTGNFAQSTATHKFASNMRSDVKAVTEFLAQNNASARLTRQIRSESWKYDDSIEALVAEAYGIETGAWIGASLDQGVWYDMRAPLSLPLEPGLFVTYQIEFAFTRQLPCTADSSDDACVEIVLRATPDPVDLKRLLTNAAETMSLSHKVALQLSSATYVRLVTDPRTLQFYESDIRRLSYWTIKGTKYYKPMIETERTHAISGPIARTE
jgi:hypothetical protein